MLARIVSALVLIPALIAAVLYAPPWAFLLLVGTAGTLCLHEFLTLAESMGLAPQHWFGYTAFWLLLAGLRLAWLPPFQLVAVLILGAFLAGLARRGELREAVLGMMANVLGVTYIAIGLYPALALRQDFGQPGVQWLLLAFVIIWSGDTLALLVGKKWGRTPFAPRLSPKKTNEGALAGIAAGVLAAFLFRRYLWTDLPPGHVIAVALLIGAFGQAGDLAESLLKRAAGVKDSSHLIPGHGGVLDRLDSLLFALPVLYIYVTFLYA